MFSWLAFHIQKFITYLTAPILFHCNVDGYIMTAYFTIHEMGDVYGLFIMATLTTLVVVYYRNSIFAIYLRAKTLLVKLYTSPNLGNKTISQISNKTKSLILNVFVFWTTSNFFTSFFTTIKKYLKK